MLTDKRCRRCEQVKPVADFHKAARRLDGLADWCKPCRSAYSKTPRAKETKKQDFQKHKAKRIEWQQAYHERNRERYRERMAAAGRRAYARNPEKFKAKQHAKRLQLAATATLTPEQWLETLETFNHHCSYCLNPLSPNGIEQEHMQPVSRGGDYSQENIIPACRSCNASKGDKNLLEFVAYLNNQPIGSNLSNAA